jgi:hypothetical protein
VSDDVVIIDRGRVLANSSLADFVGGAPGDKGRTSLEERYLGLVGGVG